ncbi:MAG: glycosyltransferase family 4 protein [Pseudomonadota bacterium]
MSASPVSTAAAPLRLLAVASHPIQYHAPWFRALAARPELELCVLFAERPDAQQQGRGFGIAFTWDVPVLEGYAWRDAPTRQRGRPWPAFLARSIARPAQLLRELRPDVVLLTGWHVWPLLQMLLAASRAGIPVVMRGEANALRARPRHVRALHRWLLGHCAAFLPIGRASRAFYQGYGVPDAQLFDAPYFVDNGRFAGQAAQCEPRHAELRARWSIPAEAACFCYAGKLEPKKRILDLLEALKRAIPLSPRRLHLLVVGTGELMDEAQAFAAEHNLPVSFAGFLNQSEIPCAYAAADALVLPSDFGETWGLVVNEAMACGRAAVVSDRAGCAVDLVVPGETGAVFPFGDTAALARALADLASDPARLRAMGECARAHVMQGYTVERSAEATVRAVQHVVKHA